MDDNYEVDLTIAEVEALCKFINELPAKTILDGGIYLSRALRKILELEE